MQGTVGALSAVVRKDESFAWLLGERIGEAKNPGPLAVATSSPGGSGRFRGVRVGEAKNLFTSQFYTFFTSQFPEVPS